jgi:hypothetical protein
MLDSLLVALNPVDARAWVIAPLLAFKQALSLLIPPETTDPE